MTKATQAAAALAGETGAGRRDAALWGRGQIAPAVRWLILLLVLVLQANAIFLPTIRSYFIFAQVLRALRWGILAAAALLLYAAYRRRGAGFACAGVECLGAGLSVVLYLRFLEGIDVVQVPARFLMLPYLLCAAVTLGWSVLVRSGFFEGARWRRVTAYIQGREWSASAMRIQAGLRIAAGVAAAVAACAGGYLLLMLQSPVLGALVLSLGATLAIIFRLMKTRS